VDLDLRDHFDRAVRADPGGPLGALADAAIAEGGRLRRRRHRRVAGGLAAGVVAVAGAVAVLTLPPDAPGPAGSPATVAAAMIPVPAPACLPQPVDIDATDVVVLLAAATDGQRSAVGTALRDDPRVDTLLFESRAQAYERFRTRFADNPDLVAAVGAGRFPESFRLRLRATGEYAAFRLRSAAADGVTQVVGRRCTPDAPVGGVL
jgi:hypothetical protein